jgi:hypothetical protein
MQEKSEKNKYKVNFLLPRFTQISESHCGPAVIQMLLANLDIEVSQEAIAEAGGATRLIELNGMRVDQLSQAVHELAPQTCFWYKDKASIQDLITLVEEYNYPVGVEWQGDFDTDIDDEEEDEEDNSSETGDDDYGHYSIVTAVRPDKGVLVIDDPYKDFRNQDRIFTIQEFERRWYDFNEVTDLETGNPRYVEDYHMLFLVTLKEQNWPKELGMKKG